MKTIVILDIKGQQKKLSYRDRGPIIFHEIRNKIHIANFVSVQLFNINMPVIIKLNYIKSP